MVELRMVRPLLVSALLGLAAGCRAEVADPVVTLLCQGGLIDDAAAAQMVAYSDELRADPGKPLLLSEACATEIETALGKQPNPYLLSLQVAAGEQDRAALRAVLVTLYESTFAIEPAFRLSTDRTLAFYARLACGPDRSCVEDVIVSAPAFHVEASPVFCDFADGPVDARLAASLARDDFVGFGMICGGGDIAGWMQAFDEMRSLQ